MASTLARRASLSGCGACAKAEATLNKTADSRDAVRAFVDLISAWVLTPVVLGDFFVYGTIGIAVSRGLWIDGRARKDVDRVEPCLDETRPVGYRKIGGAQAVAVATLRIEMEFGGDLCFFERLKVQERVLFVNGIVFGLKKEGRRSVR